MDPYCEFCDNRCFVHMPDKTPEYIIKAYEGYKIIATCPEGQKFERLTVGYCYDDIQDIIKSQESK